jgi:hypothetical protein
LLSVGGAGPPWLDCVLFGANILYRIAQIEKDMCLPGVAHFFFEGCGHLARLKNARRTGYGRQGLFVCRTSNICRPPEAAKKETSVTLLQLQSSMMAVESLVIHAVFTWCANRHVTLCGSQRSKKAGLQWCSGRHRGFSSLGVLSGVSYL